MSPEDAGRLMGQNRPGETGPPRGGGIKGGQSPEDEERWAGGVK